MRTGSLLFLLMISLAADCQNIFPAKFQGCVTDRFELESKIYAASDKDSLLLTIVSNLEKDIANELRGEVRIQVIIDTSGNPCCLSAENNLNSSLGRLHLDEIINTKTKWSKPVRTFDAEMIKVSATILLRFDKKRITFKRLGFNGKTHNWQELESCFIVKSQ